jgi:Fe/S biogenesis protein NfuA
VSESDLFDQIDQIFKEQINPAVAQHGGRVDLIDVDDGVVLVRMMGGCQGCGMANQTLKQGIEASLKGMLPDIKEVRDITDHSGGTNPYYKSP